MRTLPDPVQRVLLAALVVGPVMMALATVVGITSGELFANQWQGGLGVLATGAWVAGPVGLALLLSERAPRTGAVLLVIVFVTLVTGAGWGVDYISGAVHGERLSATPDQNPAILLLMLPGVLGPPAMAALGIGLWRTNVVPAAAGITYAVGALAFPLGRIPEVAAFTVTSDLLLLVGALLILSAVRERVTTTHHVPVAA